MKLWVATLATMLASAPAIGQINTAIADASLKPVFDKANACLNAFDAKAKAKKLSADMYKAALDGACTTEIRDMRGLYSLDNVRSESHDYLVQRLDKNVEDAKAAMVTAYVMR